MSVSMLCEQLVKQGISVEVFTTTANGKNELAVTPGRQVNVDGVNVQYFKRVTKDHSHFSPFLLIALWKNSREFDLVHIHAWWNLVSVLSCLVAVSRKVPVLLSPRGTLSPYSFGNKKVITKSIIHSFIGKYLLRRCNIHTTTTRESEAILRVITPQSITMLPNFVKLPPEIQPVPNSASNCLRLIFFSRIEEKKGLDILLNALKLISVPYHLTIAGAGDEKYIDGLKIIAESNHVADKITWAGFHNDNKFELLREHDLFVLPSHDENFGNAVIESLSVGTAVLVSDKVGLAEYVAENNLGWVCQTNETSISDTINQIAQQQADELARIRVGAPPIIYQDFKEDNLVKKYISMYNKLIKT